MSAADVIKNIMRIVTKILANLCISKKSVRPQDEGILEAVEKTYDYIGMNEGILYERVVGTCFGKTTTCENCRRENGGRIVFSKIRASQTIYFICNNRNFLIFRILLSLSLLRSIAPSKKV